VFKIVLLSICVEYELETWLANRDEIIILELDMQLVGNQNSNYTRVRATEDIRVLTLEVHRYGTVYEVDTRLELLNEISVYGTDM